MAAMGTGSPPAAAAPAITAADLAGARRVMDAAGQQAWDRAWADLEKIRGAAVRKAMRWYLLIRPGSGASFDDLTGFALDNPDWPGLTRLRRNAEAEITEETPAPAVATWYKRFGPLSTKGWQAYARALRATGGAAAVPLLVRTAWRTSPMDRRDQAEFRKVFRAYLKPADHAARVRRLLAQRRGWRAARRLMAAVRLPAADRAAFQVRIQMQRRRNGSQDNAIGEAVERLTETQRRREGFLLDEIRWLRRQDRFDEAAGRLRHAPGTPAWLRRWLVERTILAYEFLRQKKWQAAYDAIADHRQPGGYGRARAEFVAGWIALRRLKKPAVALGHFRTLLAISRFSISRARGAYWIARAHAAAGKPKLAGAWYRTAAAYPLTFYGQLAAKKLNRKSLNVPSTPPPPPAVKAAFEKEPLVVAAHLFHRLDEPRTVRVILWRLVGTAREPLRMHLVSQLAHSLNVPPMGVRAARRALMRQHPAVKAAFPQLDYARHPRVERALIHAIIRQESEFDPDAVSPANARGLMQIIPSTARRMARATRQRYRWRKLTEDPRYNVSLGTAYLDRLLRRFDGAYVLTIAAYNAGPTRVARWIAENGDPRKGSQDLIDWLELVPIGETRNYVQRVLENLAVYRALAGKPALNRDLRALWRSPHHK